MIHEGHCQRSLSRLLASVKFHQSPSLINASAHFFGEFNDYRNSSENSGKRCYVYPLREALARSRSRQTAGFSRQQPERVGPRSDERGYSESAFLNRVRYKTSSRRQLPAAADCKIAIFPKFASSIHQALQIARIWLAANDE